MRNIYVLAPHKRAITFLEHELDRSDNIIYVNSIEDMRGIAPSPDIVILKMIGYRENPNYSPIFFEYLKQRGLM